MNLSAAMDVASNAAVPTSLASRQQWRRIRHNSAAVLARWTWPNAEHVFNDSGVGLGLADNDAFLLNIINDGRLLGA